MIDEAPGFCLKLALWGYLYDITFLENYIVLSPCNDIRNNPFFWRATHNLTCFRSGCLIIILFLNVSNLLLAKKRHNNEKLTLKQHLAVKVVLYNGLEFSSLHDVWEEWAGTGDKQTPLVRTASPTIQVHYSLLVTDLDFMFTQIPPHLNKCWLNLE